MSMWLIKKLKLQNFLLLLFLISDIFAKDFRIKAEFIPPHIVLPAVEENPLQPKISSNSPSLLVRIGASNSASFLVISPQISNDQPISAYSARSAEIKENNGSEERKLKSAEEEFEGKDPFELLVQKTWRVIVGDVCQLPNFRRPTERENFFVECMPIDKNLASRNDLGIWRLRKCPTRTAFVPSAQICLPEHTIRLQHLLCSSQSEDEEKMEEAAEKIAKMAIIQGCPPKNSSEIWITNRRKYSIPMPTNSKCKETTVPKEKCRQKNSTQKCKKEENMVKNEGQNDDGGEEWEEMEVEVVEPCPIPTMDRLRRQYGQWQNSWLPPCPCPPQRTNCICVEPQSRQPQMFMDCCCVQKQIPPCLCTPIPDQKPIVLPPSPSHQQIQGTPPHILEMNNGQMFRVEIGQQQNFGNQRNPYGPPSINPVGQNSLGGNFRGETIHGAGVNSGACFNLRQIIDLASNQN